MADIDALIDELVFQATAFGQYQNSVTSAPMLLSEARAALIAYVRAIEAERDDLKLHLETLVNLSDDDKLNEARAELKGGDE